MPEIKCPWDMCIHNTKCYADVEGKCTKDSVELVISGERNQFLTCGDYNSVISERRTLNA